MPAFFGKAETLFELKAELEHRFPDCGDQLQDLGHGFYLPGTCLENTTAAATPPTAWWALDSLIDARILEYSSIKDAARQLNQLERGWQNWSGLHYGRSELIKSHLKPARTAAAGQPADDLTKHAEPGRPVFAVLDHQQLVYGRRHSNPFGIDAPLAEDLPEAPSRAVYKLQEVFQRLQWQPTPDQKALEIGASPGGWTWFLARLDMQVDAWDRSPLRKDLLHMPAIRFRQGDAFKVQPGDIHPVEWFFSDLICEPERLWRYLQPWLYDSDCQHFVCTLKMKGQSDLRLLERFQSIPNSRIWNLYYNKHELTWIHSKTRPLPEF
ncbi:MAG: hypothetical protein KDK39_07910 [Leptospiraceae bacterium]|nr:hypothetical protein [Leptospiraceae bacterium]